jgi:hypothetical protein
MKTTTKSAIFSLALISAIILISSFTKQTSGTKYATIRSIETVMGGSKIILAYDGKTEEMGLENGTIKNMTPNTLKINDAINMMAAKGYELVSQSGGETISMYTFVKK